MKARFFCLVCGLLLAFSSLCCQRREGTSVSGPTVALVVKTVNHPYFIDMQQGAEAAAKRLGVNLIVQGAEREVDIEKQMQIVENLIQKKVDAICLAPSGSRELVPAVVKANRAGIPVIILDTRIDPATLREAGGKVVTFIGSDNYEGGKVAGAQIVQLLKGYGSVAILEGIPGHETGDARRRGFHAVVDQVPGIKVVASQTANWERDQGFNVFQNMLQAHADIQALFACSDLMALGAIEAIAAAGKTGQIVVVGFDAVKDARDAIRHGTMAASVAQHPDEMGRLGVESAYHVLRGDKVPDYLPVKIELITKQNLE
ncbi:MAG TPA: sugar ABC transporter substrate-binding protein [Acidobacteriota bacterium]|nr:sugar ABC transporter substrate-binding protein [Acidobacteriota bacterium]